jgi:hypothetical protein
VRDVIWLVCNGSAVDRMTKRQPTTGRSEIPVKLIIEMPDSAFRSPVLERHVVIDDWREGTDLADVELKQDVITREEADLIVARRIAKMRELLENHGYTVTPPGGEHGADCPDPDNCGLPH